MFMDKPFPFGSDGQQGKKENDYGHDQQRDTENDARIHDRVVLWLSPDDEREVVSYNFQIYA
jgi:hypothetical protein